MYAQQFNNKYLHYSVLLNFLLKHWHNFFNVLMLLKCLLFPSHTWGESGPLCCQPNFPLTAQLWIFTETLNIDCCVLTQSRNEIKTNINHMLARQQTLLEPLWIRTDSSPFRETLTPFIHVNLNFKCCGIYCMNSSIQVLYMHVIGLLFEQRGVRSAASCVIVDLPHFALRWK